jgi:hypothetical protein
MFQTTNQYIVHGVCEATYDWRAPASLTCISEIAYAGQYTAPMVWAIWSFPNGWE